MSISQSCVRAHDATMVTAESVRQIAINAAGNLQSAARNAEITFYRSAIASAKTNGISTAVYATALRELGVNS